MKAKDFPRDVGAMCIEKLVAFQITKWTEFLEAVLIRRAKKGFLSKKDISLIFKELLDDEN